MIEADSEWVERAPKSSLGTASLDSANGERLVSSELPVVAFDAAKDAYVRNLTPKPSGRPESVDAMMVARDGRAVFVEFKNKRDFKKSESNAIANKAYSSLIILCDSLGLPISSARRDVDFIVVYKGDSRDAIAHAVSSRGTRAVSLGALRQKLESFCFHKVLTLTSDEFELDYLAEFESAL